MAIDVAAPARVTTWQQVRTLAASPMAPFYFIVASVAVLSGLGLLMVLSASSVIALDRGVGPYYYLGKQVSVWTAVLYCFLVFVPGDLVKSVIAALIAKRMIPVLQKNNLN